MSKNQYNIDLDVVKKPGKDKPLTPEQEEMWFRYAEDPMAFFTEQCYVRGDRGKVLFQPREYQEDMLNVVMDNTHTVISSPRQSGKCTQFSTKIAAKVNGIVQEITIGEFHEMMKSKNNS